MSVLSNQLVNTLNSSKIDTSINGASTDKNAAEMGRDDFLLLLVAQLTYQDPLNPMDDTDFTAQLAQFSSLDQLITIADGIDTMNGNSTQQNLLSSAGFIGKEIRANGYSVTKSEGAVENIIYVYLAEDISKGTVNIYDSSGTIVYSEATGAKSADEVFEYKWNGKNYNGENMPDGVYYVTVKGENASGSEVKLTTEISGIVAGVQLVNGVQYFRLADGRNVRLADIIEVVNSSTVAAGGTDSGTESTTGAGG